jgi:RNA polymerase sigma-70 factor (ECF subfamily)
MVTALNRGRDLARRHRRHAAKAPFLAVAEGGPPGENHVDDQMAVMALLAGVTDRQRQALVLRFIAQLTVPEIAEIMHCAEGTVKSTLHTALDRALHAQKGLADVPD